MLVILVGQHSRPHPLIPKPSTLSEREVQVLTRFAKEITGNTVAAWQNFDGRTVSTYQARLYDQLVFRALSEKRHLRDAEL